MSASPSKDHPRGIQAQVWRVQGPDATQGAGRAPLRTGYIASMRTPAIGSGQRYRPGLLLSEDALGTLWKGTDVRSGSTVTIRLLDERLVSDPQAVHRAVAHLRWAQFEARNAHLTRVLDHSLRLGSRPAFVVSEGFTGETLSQHLNRGEALSLRRALEVFAAVAEGVGSAHAAWISHGSLTAASILLDDRVVAKVVDVGLGELLDDTSQRPVSATRFEDREATDVLAVARLLKDVLSGRPRQPGMATEGASAVEIEISTELSDLIQRALSPHRLHRPTMAELAAALAPDLDAISSPEGIRHDGLPSPPKDDRFEQVSAGDASDGYASEPSVAQVTPMVSAAAPVKPLLVEPPAAAPAEPLLVEPPAAEHPPVEPLLMEPAAAEALLAEAPPTERPTAEQATAEQPTVEGATRPAKRARLARPRLPVVLGASVVVLGLIVGVFIASRGTDAEDQGGDAVRPTPTPSATSEPPSPEPIVPATVPALLGKPLERATGLLERAGLVVGSVIPVLGEEGVVVRIDPTQGEAVPAGTVVDLFVGSGAD